MSLSFLLYHSMLSSLQLSLGGCHLKTSTLLLSQLPKALLWCLGTLLKSVLVSRHSLVNAEDAM